MSAVDEACAAVVRHAERCMSGSAEYSAGDDKPLALQCTFGPGVLGRVISQREVSWHAALQVGIHHEDLEAAIQTYQMLSERWFTHASPTLFNAGTPRPQMSSCFLICMKVRDFTAHTECVSVLVPHTCLAITARWWIIEEFAVIECDAIGGLACRLSLGVFSLAE